MSKLLKKFVAVLLVITLAGANLSIIGMYGITYALTDTELAGQTTTTGNSNVEFNSYFEGGGHVKTESLDTTDAKLFINIKVKNAGYLKNGMINLNDVNFKISGDINSENVQSIDKENNSIVLKQLNNGSDVTLEIPISILKDEYVSLDNFSKESKTTFTGIYVDGNGKEKNISKEIVNKLSWNGTAEGILELELTKYIPYAIGDKYGVMLQTKVNSGISNSTLPIKNTEINIQVPEINGIKPTSVNVIAINTKASNGLSNGIEFTSDNYIYDEETKTVKITVANKEDEIAWLKNVKDEYLVTFIYDGQEIYNYANENGVNTKVTTSAKIEVYNNEETIVDVPEVATEIDRTEKLGTIADFDVLATNKISKGQIYANYDSTAKKETGYSVRYTMTVNSADLTDKIEFMQAIDKFLTSEGAKGATTVSGNNYAYNKIVKVSEKVFNKILGEEGTIDVYKADKTKIGTINKETELIDGNYVLDVSNSNCNELYIVASKPITEGQLVIDVNKALKSDIGYSKEQVKTFEKIETGVQGKASTSSVTASGEILLKEPTSVATISISKKDLTTVVKNEDVEIRATLDTSSVYNALYKDSTLKIKLPLYISKVDIKNYDIVMANGLKIKGTPQVTKEDGMPVILIELEGTQEEYTIDAEYQGTIVVLNTDLTVKTLTPSNSNKITMEYTNNNEILTNNKGTVETALNFVAPTGIVTANGISNYAEGASDVLSISSENKTVTLETQSEERTAKISGIIINNYENKINNIKVLGRIPAQGNKKIDENTDLGSTFTTPMSSDISITGVESEKYTIYYSENENAGTDISNAANGWSNKRTANAKSYLIVMNEYDMEAGERIDFSYNIDIEDKLTHNNSAYEMYKVYYDNVTSIGTMEELKVSSVVGMTTGQGPELTAELKPNIETVREGQIVKMIATVKNTGSVTAENIKVTIKAPEHTSFVTFLLGSMFEQDSSDEKVLNVGTLEAGKSKEISYYLQVEDYTFLDFSSPQEIINTAKIDATDLTNPIEIQSTMSIQKGDVAIEMIGDAPEDETLLQGREINYYINLRNISLENEQLENVVATIEIPEGLKYEKAVYTDAEDPENEITTGISYDDSTRTLKIEMGTLKLQKTINLKVLVEEVDGNISMVTKAVATNIEENYSNIVEYNVEKAEIEVSELTSTPKYVKEGEDVTYSFQIKNNGTAYISNVQVVDELPEGLAFEKAVYSVKGVEAVATTLRDGKVVLDIVEVNPEEIIDVQIIARAEALEDKNDKEVKNQVSVKVGNTEEIKTNTVTNIIEYNEEIHRDVITGGGIVTTDGRYKITGTAWMDENKDGKRDDSEELLQGIEVMLINKSNNAVVKDLDTGAEKKATTGSDGKYQFDNIPKGQYFVLFIYDASRYNITTYQSKGVDTSLNSDVISINVMLDGERKIAGISDALSVTNSNIRDIDIGLYSSEKFDLRLDKYISKITLTTPTIGTKTYTYSNSKLEKVEVLGKNVGKSNIAIEYKIVITNEGAIAGYAKKIVDYLPEGVGFNTELNKDWYLSENGNVYNASLANTIINPGESKEITLVLTKKITEDSLGTILNNNAEIYESYNEQGLQDMDSTVANKAQDEDDMSKADVLLSLVTGRVIMYTTITLGVIVLLGFGIYEIKRRVLNKK